MSVRSKPHKVRGRGVEEVRVTDIDGRVVVHTGPPTPSEDVPGRHDQPRDARRGGRFQADFTIAISIRSERGRSAGAGPGASPT